MSKIAVQIGTNDAVSEDIFHEVCVKESFDHIHLIEPMMIHNKNIKKTYDNINKNYTIHNIAITSLENVDSVKMYLLSDDTSHNSLIKRKSHPNSKTNLYIEIPCKTFNNFCRDNNINEIDFLCIDTEGLDCEIILGIDFENIKIRRIYWEEWIHEFDDINNIYNTGVLMLESVFDKLLNYKYKIIKKDERNFEAIKE